MLFELLLRHFNAAELFNERASKAVNQRLYGDVIILGGFLPGNYTYRDCPKDVEFKPVEKEREEEEPQVIEVIKIRPTRKTRKKKQATTRKTKRRSTRRKGGKRARYVY